MATHSGILAWKILWTEEPGGPQSMGSQKNQIQLSDWVPPPPSPRWELTFSRPHQNSSHSPPHLCVWRLITLVQCPRMQRVCPDVLHCMEPSTAAYINLLKWQLLWALSLFREGVQFSLRSPKCAEVLSHACDLAFILPLLAPNSPPCSPAILPLPCDPCLAFLLLSVSRSAGEWHGSPRVPALQWWVPRGWWQSRLVPPACPQCQKAGPSPLLEDRVAVQSPGRRSILVPLSSQPLTGEWTSSQQPSSGWGHPVC